MPHPSRPSSAARIAAPLLALLMLLAGSAPAAPVDLSADAARAAGLSFLITSNFNVSGFDGALLSWRTRGEDGRGWRFGLNLAATYKNRDRSLYDDEIFQDLTAGERLYRVSITTLRVYESRRTRALGFYWAAGPGVGYEFSRYNPGLWSYGTELIRTTIWDAGLSGAVGVEWLASDGISLMAEYGMALAYTWQREHEVRQDSEGIYEMTDTWSEVRISGRQARLGLTAWFR